MSDDDDLRDAFGDDIRAALHERARVEPLPDVAFDVERRNHTRARSRVLVATLAAAIALGGVAVIATRSDDTKRIGVVTPASSPRTSTTVVRSGFRVVSYHGVHVEVPARWPVVDGMHTGFCTGPFSDAPTAFVGPQENGSPSCPYVPSLRDKKRDGVWLQSGDQPGDARRSTTSSGAVVFQDTAGWKGSIKYVWYRGVSLTIGIGPDVRVAESILDSIGFTPGAPDTPAAGRCARIDHPNSMPEPERLTTRLVLEHGNSTLDPPLPSDRAVMTAAQAWTAAGTRPDFEHARLVLARYSATLPATQHADGSLTPDHQNQLMWIVLSAPNSPDVQGCGMWGYHLFDARTGQDLESAGYTPGP
jgi:hypothetical protein